MATKVRIVFNSAGFAQVLQLPALRADIERRTNAIAAAAGDGMEAEVIDANYGGSPRPIGIVSTGTYEARKAEAEGKALSKGIDAGR